MTGRIIAALVAALIIVFLAAHLLILALLAAAATPVVFYRLRLGKRAGRAEPDPHHVVARQARPQTRPRLHHLRRPAHPLVAGPRRARPRQALPPGDEAVGAADEPPGRLQRSPWPRPAPQTRLRLAGRPHLGLRPATRREVRRGRVPHHRQPRTRPGHQHPRRPAPADLAAARPQRPGRGLQPPGRRRCEVHVPVGPRRGLR